MSETRDDSLSNAIWALSVSELLDKVADRTPAPGGGAVASVVGALGAALASMAMNYSLRKSTPENDRQRIESVLAALERDRSRYLKFAGEDARAYGEMNRLQKLPADDPERRDKWGDAVIAATEAPMGVVRLGVEMLRRLDPALDHCNRWLLSDFAIAAELAEAACRAGAWNVRVNLPVLEEDSPGVAAQLRGEMDRLLEEASKRVRSIGVRCQA